MRPSGCILIWLLGWGRGVGSLGVLWVKEGLLLNIYSYFSFPGKVGGKRLQGRKATKLPWREIYMHLPSPAFLSFRAGSQFTVLHSRLSFPSTKLLENTGFASAHISIPSVHQPSVLRSESVDEMTIVQQPYVGRVLYTTGS